MQIWLTILASCPDPASPIRVQAREKAIATGLDAVEDRLFAAAHDGEHAVLRAGLAAGDRRVDEVQSGLACGLMKFARDVGRGGRVVDEEAAGGHAGESAVRPEDDAAQVGIVADAAEDDLRPGGGFARRGGHRSACPSPAPDWPFRFRTQSWALAAVRL